MEKAEGRTQTN